MAEWQKPFSAIFFLSREDDDDDVRDIGKLDFRSVVPHPMLSNANQALDSIDPEDDFRLSSGS